MEPFESDGEQIPVGLPFTLPWNDDGRTVRLVEHSEHRSVLFIAEAWMNVHHVVGRDRD